MQFHAMARVSIENIVKDLHSSVFGPLTVQPVDSQDGIIRCWAAQPLRKYAVDVR